MNFIDLVKERYSVRKFKEDVVEEEKLSVILEAGRLAPTAHNAQPQRIKVIASKEELLKVDECTPCRFNAPLMLLICYDKNLSWKRVFDGKDSGDVDASIVTTHMMLAARDIGLGSCWVMYFDPAKARTVFSLSDNLIPVAFMPIGYEADDAVPSDSHNMRNDIKDMLI